ncbi:hypothetical protein P7H16_24920 [Paenibacillus larvae]|nr:hypothetical protein [Paenibacillus larvae]MDT2249507.1 hypothetical protein [Paenibacillus larvae]
MEYSIRMKKLPNAIGHGIGVLLSIGALAALILFRPIRGCLAYCQCQHIQELH